MNDLWNTETLSQQTQQSADILEQILRYLTSF